MAYLRTLCNEEAAEIMLAERMLESGSESHTKSSSEQYEKVTHDEKQRCRTVMHNIMMGNTLTDDSYSSPSDGDEGF